MEIVRTVADLRAAVAGWRSNSHKVGLTPTMGALHEGHLSLIDVARQHAERVVATIFVNPTQFGAGEDLSAYPRDEERDAKMLRDHGCDLLFAPDAGEMYPPGFSTEVRVTGLTDRLCGASRPGHLDGVAQVVTKLLNQARADVAVFGQKDWQQLVVIRRLVADLDIATRIVGAPILREPDGLAMSSRNRYLSAAERQVAGRLNQVVARAAARIESGANPALELAGARALLIQLGFDKVDYVALHHAETLEPLTSHDSEAPARIFAAAHIGKARLIDNMAVGGDDREREPD